MNFKYGLVSTLITIGSCVAGCSAQNGDNEVSNSPEADDARMAAGDPAEVFTETVVFKQADGSVGVAQSTITRAEQVARHEARVARRLAPTVRPRGFLVQTANCSTAEVRLYDQTNYTGNTLCFDEYTQYGEGIDLAGIHRTNIFCGGVATSLKWFGKGTCTSLYETNRVRSIDNPDTNIYFSSGGTSADYPSYLSPYPSASPGNRQYLHSY
jgi:hypothetical protein